MSEIGDKLRKAERLGEKLSLMIYLQNFLKAGEDVDGNPFVSDSGARVREESIKEVLDELETIEGSMLDELGEVYDDPTE